MPILEDNLMLYYYSPPEMSNKSFQTYNAKNMKLQSERLTLNPSELNVQHKPVSFNNSVNLCDTSES